MGQVIEFVRIVLFAENFRLNLSDITKNEKRLCFSEIYLDKMKRKLYNDKVLLLYGV